MRPRAGDVAEGVVVRATAKGPGGGTASREALVPPDTLGLLGGLSTLVEHFGAELVAHLADEGFDEAPEVTSTTVLCRLGPLAPTDPLLVWRRVG